MKRIVLLICICCGIISPLLCQGRIRNQNFVRQQIGIPAYMAKYDELYNFYIDISTSTTAARKVKLEALKGQMIDWVGIVSDSTQSTDGSYLLLVNLGGNTFDMIAEETAKGTDFISRDSVQFFRELIILIPITREDVLKYKKGDYIHMNRKVADFEMPRDIPLHMGPSIILARQ